MKQAVSSTGKDAPPSMVIKACRKISHLFFLEREEARHGAECFFPKKRFAKRRVRWIGCATALEKPPRGALPGRRKISGPLGMRIALASQGPNLCRFVASCAVVCASTTSTAQSKSWPSWRVPLTHPLLYFSPTKALLSLSCSSCQAVRLLAHGRALH